MKINDKNTVHCLRDLLKKADINVFCAPSKKHRVNAMSQIKS